MASTFSPEEVAYERAHWNEDKGPAMIAGGIVLIGFATVAVILRLMARKMKRLPWMADDYFIVAALVSSNPGRKSTSR